jgi:adenylate kinase
VSRSRSSSSSGTTKDSALMRMCSWGRMSRQGHPGCPRGRPLGRVHLSTGESSVPASATAPSSGHGERYMDAGEYVPDSVTNAMVRARLGESDVERGFLLAATAHSGPGRRADESSPTSGRSSTGVVVCRWTSRSSSAGCLNARAPVAAPRHRRRHPAPAAGLRRQTAPLLALYSERGLVFEVDGRGTVGRCLPAYLGRDSATAGRGLKRWV